VFVTSERIRKLILLSPLTVN